MAVVNLLLVIYSSLLIKKHDYIVVRIISMTLSLVVYALGFCWSSVIINMFTILRDTYNDHVKKPKTAIIALFCIFGTLLTILVNHIIASSEIQTIGSIYS